MDYGDDTLSPEEIQLIRSQLLAQAQQELSEPKPLPIRVSTVAPRTVKLKRPPSKSGAPIRADSIRQVIMGLLLEGKTTDEITEVITAKYPGSKAAEKSAIHIAYYRSKLRKSNKLPTRRQLTISA